MSDTPNLASWQCHKVVRAGKIRELINGQRAGSDAVVAMMVEAIDGSSTEVCPGDAFFARGAPALGDYLVIYDDDYISWSPAKAFEEGYSYIHAAVND